MTHRVTSELRDLPCVGSWAMALGYPDSMALQACPFCRKLYTNDEARLCPDCDVALVDMNQLPPSLDALADDVEQGKVTFPEDKLLPWTYAGRGRAALLALSLLGLACFFLPWVELVKPEIDLRSGYDLARGRAGWLWGGVTGWLVLIPLVLTRRTIARMRGVRIVTVMFAAMTFTEVVMLLLLPPKGGAVPVEVHFQYGLFLSGAVSLVAMVVAARFGGSLDNLPEFLLDTREAGPAQEPEAHESSDGHTLH